MSNLSLNGDNYRKYIGREAEFFNYHQNNPFKGILGGVTDGEYVDANTGSKWSHCTIKEDQK